MKHAVITGLIITGSVMVFLFVIDTCVDNIMPFFSDPADIMFAVFIALNFALVCLLFGYLMIFSYPETVISHETYPVSSVTASKQYPRNYYVTTKQGKTYDIDEGHVKYKPTTKQEYASLIVDEPKSGISRKQLKEIGINLHTKLIVYQRGETTHYLK